MCSRERTYPSSIVVHHAYLSVVFLDKTLRALFLARSSRSAQTRSSRPSPCHTRGSGPGSRTARVSLEAAPSAPRTPRCTRALTGRHTREPVADVRAPRRARRARRGLALRQRDAPRRDAPLRRRRGGVPERERQRVHGETARVFRLQATRVRGRAPSGDGNGEGSPRGGKRARPGGARPVVEHRERRVGRRVARRHTSIPRFRAVLPPERLERRETRSPDTPTSVDAGKGFCARVRVSRADGGDDALVGVAPGNGVETRVEFDAPHADRPIAPAGCEHVRGRGLVRVRVCFRKLAKSFAEAERGPRAGALRGSERPRLDDAERRRVQNADRARRRARWRADRGPPGLRATHDAAPRATGGPPRPPRRTSSRDATFPRPLRD